MPFLSCCLQCLILSPSSGPINFLTSHRDTPVPWTLLSPGLSTSFWPHIHMWGQHMIIHWNPLSTSLSTSFASYVWHNHHSRSTSALLPLPFLSCHHWRKLSLDRQVSPISFKLETHFPSFFFFLLLISGQLLLFSITDPIFTISPNPTIDLSFPYSWTFKEVSCFSIKKAEMSILIHISTSLQSFS